MIYDLIIILAIIAIPLLAQLYIKITYGKYIDVECKSKKSGFEVARAILDANGLNNIDIVSTSGTLTDHYDPSRKVVRLSQEVFDGESIASTAVAAHECGHAIQDKEGYALLRIRSLLVPVVNIATSISYYIILIGFIFQVLGLVIVGIAFTCMGLIFQLVTLPVEINASKRAGNQLAALGLALGDDAVGTKKVLTAAAMTYLAGVVASALQVIRLILIYGRRD